MFEHPKFCVCSGHRLLISIGVRAGGGGGGGARGAAAPAVTEIFKFFGQNADDSGKSTREKTL